MSRLKLLSFFVAAIIALAACGGAPATGPTTAPDTSGGATEAPAADATEAPAADATAEPDA